MTGHFLPFTFSQNNSLHIGLYSCLEPDHRLVCYLGMTWKLLAVEDAVVAAGDGIVEVGKGRVEAMATTAIATMIHSSHDQTTTDSNRILGMTAVD